jgi:LmbE family N-acetylglucosaminyl deacetylase
MKFLNFNRVLCLSPHPDDAEYSIAGTVIKYQDTYFDILCLTQGGDCDTTTGYSRVDEVCNAWKTTQATNYTLYFSGVKLLKEFNVDRWVNFIETYTEICKYECILVPSEYDSHFEHVIVSSFAAPLSRVKPYSVIEYKSPSTLDRWIPNLFVPLGNIYPVKQNMLSQFKSQLNKEYFTEQVINGFHTNFQSMKKGLGFVESYKIITKYE